MSAFLEVRPFTPIDLPLVHRLTPRGLCLDSATSLTRGVNALEGAFWGSVPLADLGTPTFVLRENDSGYVAQFRHRAGEQHAHIVFIAPDLRSFEDAWLYLLDGMVVAAGRRGALTLNAEVEETSPAFVVLQRAGFGIYARQDIWRRDPGPLSTQPSELVRSASENDAWGISSLYIGIVPRMVMQVDPPPEAKHSGLVYVQGGQILAHFTAQEGKYGVYVQSLLHPELRTDHAENVIAAALGHLPRADRLPLYFCVRRYQSWLGGAFSSLGFERWGSQAVMVKHTASRIEEYARPIRAQEGVRYALPHVPRDGAWRVDEVLSVKQRSLNGISYHRRSGKTQGSAPSLSG